MSDSILTAPKFDPDSYWQNEINKLCRLPRIGRNDAFKLWHSAVNLVCALDELKGLTSRQSVKEISTLVRTLASRSKAKPAVATLAAKAVGLIAKHGSIKRRKPARKVERAVASAAGVETRARPF
jgi:hypothetical protein